MCHEREAQQLMSVNKKRLLTFKAKQSNAKQKQLSNKSTYYHNYHHHIQPLESATQHQHLQVTRTLHSDLDPKPDRRQSLSNEEYTMSHSLNRPIDRNRTPPRTCNRRRRRRRRNTLSSFRRRRPLGVISCYDLAI